MSPHDMSHPGPPTDRVEFAIAPINTRHVVRFELDDAIIDLLRDVLPTVGGTILARISAMESRMSQLSDALAALNQSTDDALSRVSADVDALNAKVAELQAKVDAGTATPADFDTLAAIKAKLDALDPTKPDTLPPTP